jgi:hypothetical protein
MRLAKSEAPAESSQTPSSIIRLWPLIALGGLFASWLLYPAIGSIAQSLSLAKIWDGLWPLLIGAALALALRLWGDRLPRAPEGDSVVVAEAAFKASFALGALFESLDTRLRRWPAGGLSLLAIALLLAALAARS